MGEIEMKRTEIYLKTFFGNNLTPTQLNRVKNTIEYKRYELTDLIEEIILEIIKSIKNLLKWRR